MPKRPSPSHLERSRLAQSVAVSNSRWYVGIDPGKSGGIAWVFSGTDAVVLAPLGSLTDKDVWDCLKGSAKILGPNLVNRVNRPGFVCIERVGGFIQGSKLPGSAMFNFGKSAGILEGLVIALGAPYELVTPQKWQRTLGIPARKPNESKSKYKNRLKARAQQLFPSQNITLATADALLIAEYCRRTHRGG